MEKIASDKDLLHAALACIKIIEDRFKGRTEKELEKDIYLHDAICYRMISLGQIISAVSTELKAKYNSFVWLMSCFAKDEGIWVIWDLYKANGTKCHEGESFESCYNELKKIYNQEYNLKNNCEKDFKVEDNFPYSIRTKSSIWTVKKK